MQVLRKWPMFSIDTFNGKLTQNHLELNDITEHIHLQRNCNLWNIKPYHNRSILFNVTSMILLLSYKSIHLFLLGQSLNCYFSILGKMHFCDQECIVKIKRFPSVDTQLYDVKGKNSYLVKRYLNLKCK